MAAACFHFSRSCLACFRSGKCIKGLRRAWPFLGIQTCTDTEPLKLCECGHVGLRAGSGGVLNISAWYSTTSVPPAPLPKSPSRGPRLQSPQHLKQHWREIPGTLASPYLSHEQTVRDTSVRVTPTMGHGSAQGVGSMRGLGCSPPPQDLFVWYLMFVVLCLG